MLFAFTVVDYAVLAFYLLLMLLLGAYFSREQHTSKDFFLAGRSMGWFPVGVSVMATLLSALTYTGTPGEAYRDGMKFILGPICIWLTTPLMIALVIPLYQRLEMYSIYEYLEHRFNLAVRAAGSIVFVGWRLLWMGGVLYAPCKLLVVAARLEEYLVPLLLLLGAIATAYTFLGGMKAVIWTDVIQSLVMLMGLSAIIGGVWFQLEGGAGGVWSAAERFGRTTALQFTPSDGRSFWNDRWLLWGIAPHFILAQLSFYIADQITAQRFLTARSLQDAKRSFVLNCVSFSIMLPALMYVGLSLLAFYQENDARRMNPNWVVHAAKHPETGRPMIDNRTDVAGELDELIAAGAILHPHTDKPLSPNEKEVILDDQGNLAIDRLATRQPVTGEVIMQRGFDELMPHFMVNYLLPGVAGLIFAALLAASMSSIDSGLNSTSTLIIVDFYRRLGLGKATVARLRGKPVDELDETDELWLGRWFVLVIGVAATLLSLAMPKLGTIFTIMIGVINTFGAPLLGVFLLGMFTRRCTSAAALGSLGLGMLFTIWIRFGGDLGLWPFAELDPIWSVTFGLAGTMAIGYGLSFVVGRRKSDQELRGLVVGVGQVGVRSARL